MTELRGAIIIACLIAMFSWWRAGKKNRRFVWSRWAVMLVPIFRLLFYIVRLLNICETSTLNLISSALILQTLITLAIWGWAVADE